MQNETNNTASLSSAFLSELARYIDSVFIDEERIDEPIEMASASMAPRMYAPAASSCTAVEPPKRQGLFGRRKKKVRQEDLPLEQVPDKPVTSEDSLPTYDGIDFGVASLGAALVDAQEPLGTLAERLEKIDESFAQTVLRLIDEKGMTDVEVYKRANMSRQLFAKIRKDDGYRPTKKTACALAFALELNYEDALALLARAGFTLSHSAKFDIIVEYFLLKDIHDIYQVNEALFAFDQQVLG